MCGSPLSNLFLLPSYKTKLLVCDDRYITVTCWVNWINRGWVGNISPWWRHQMETLSTLLALCAGNSPVTGEFPAQRPVTRSFDVFFDLRLNKRLSKQSWGWWFEAPSPPLWRHYNALDLSLYSPGSHNHAQSLCAPDHGELWPSLDEHLRHIQTAQNYANRIVDTQLKMVTKEWLQLWVSIYQKDNALWEEESPLWT